MAMIRFFSDLGTEVFVPVEGKTAQHLRYSVLRTLRDYGRMGWRSGTVPRGGYRFPLANEPDFDWHLIGARRGSCTIDGEERQGVWYAGQFYTRRQLEPNVRMKLAAAVKYSRGAKNTDPAEIVEDGDGSFKYVTLAVFRGDGRRREEYAEPSMTSRANAL
jgi:ssDNA-binding DdrB-like protein